jgi:exopolyphosphatase/pppGpp-phosphohydrolase
LKLENSFNATRVGIIEVGSHSVRFYVVDFKQDGSSTARETDSTLHRVGVVSPKAEEVSELARTIEGYYSRLAGFNCDHVMIYGTEVCRQISEQQEYRLPGYLRVLSPEEEARASWAAGFLTVGSLTGAGRFTIVDQGAGSTEVCTSSWSDMKAGRIHFDRLDIGHQGIMNVFESGSGYLKAIEEIKGIVAGFQNRLLRHAAIDESEICMLGSVATKIAWHKVRKRKDEKYNLYRVNGVRLSVREIFEFHSSFLALYRKDRDEARIEIDARKGAEDEIERVISNSVYLMLLAATLKHQAIRVSGFGTRHGMAFLALKGIGTAS